MEEVDRTELCIRTLEAEEVIHCPLAIWIWITSSSMTEGIGEVECEEIRRAKGMEVGELVVC